MAWRGATMFGLMTTGSRFSTFSQGSLSSSTTSLNPACELRMPTIWRSFWRGRPRPQGVFGSDLDALPLAHSLHQGRAFLSFVRE